MFLDPDPKRRKLSKDMSSAFFASQRPIASTKPQSRTSKRQSESSQQEPGNSSFLESTVRLVSPSPSPPTQPAIVSKPFGDDEDAKEEEEPEIQGADEPRLPQSPWLKEEASVSESGISAASRDFAVSDSHNRANEALITERAPSVTLLPSDPAHELPPPIWHRRSTSSGAYSQSSTLHDSELAFSKKSVKSERYSNFSQISTLRGTPSPYEQENRARAAADSETRSGLGQTLQTLQETSPGPPERLTTIRPVPPSDSSSTSEPGSGFNSAEASPRPRTSPSILDQSPGVTYLPRTRSQRTYSTGSIPSSRSRSNTRDFATPTQHRHHQRPGSQGISEYSFPQASSPNFIAYSPDSTRPISREDPLRSATSIESINSRLRHGAYGAFPLPEPGRTLATADSWASLRSLNTPPPLQVPKKRLRHKAKSESLASLASASHATDTMMEECDTLPYPKRPFSSHLSTIASESEHSRSASQHLSHFSLGSGVLTGDDESSLPLSPAHNRRSSAPAESIASSLRRTSSEFVEEAGDMTLGIFREESAIPQPLFRADRPSMLDTSKTYDGPLPPLPPIPRSRDSEENVDTLSALQAPPLRQQKSGRSLRRRSNSTPGHSRQQSQISYVESDRLSQGSNLFPIWAKRFYSGEVGLRSKLSFGSLTNSENHPSGHMRNQSSYTDRSITSRLGTGMEVEPSSPVSSHFLPSIFRPRTRKRGASQGSQRDSRSSKIRKSHRSRPSQETRGSMAIEPAPPLPATIPNHLPQPGQTRWGKLKGSPSPSPETQRRLPKKYSKQHLWDTMEFPRPMTKDRLSDFNVYQPHLHPSKRASQQRLSAWQAPSFVSSLDTLFTSRHNRQILCFVVGFICPLTWMLGAILPLPKRPMSADELEKSIAGSEEDVQAAMIKHEAGDAEKRWREEKQFLKGRWWRTLNRVMSVVGVLVIGAVIALVVVATT